MNCPVCGGDELRVLTTAAKDGQVRRQRACACGHRFFTVEAPEAVYSRASGIAEAFEAMKRAVSPGE